MCEHHYLMYFDDGRNETVDNVTLDRNIYAHNKEKRD